MCSRVGVTTRVRAVGLVFALVLVDRLAPRCLLFSSSRRHSNKSVLFRSLPFSNGSHNEVKEKTFLTKTFFQFLHLVGL